MAKWGEGDPRWIVEERPDAANVNNWHWTEKDATAWSVDKLKSLLTLIEVNSPELGSWKLSDIKPDGEASASNRKGKVIILYDWTVNGKIEGKACDATESSSGTLEIKNLSFENELEEVEINVKLQPIAKELKKELCDQINLKLKQYLESLRKDFTDGLQLPTAHGTSSQSSKKSSVEVRNAEHQDSSNSSTSGSPGLGLKISTKRAKLSDSFKCEAHELYRVFVTEELVKAFTRSDAKVEGHKGGKFMFMNGQISGEYVELDPPGKIVKKWRSKDWPEGHYSVVTIEMIQKDDCTDLSLVQTGIPSSDHERIKDGWKRLIFEPIKSTFGYGARIL